MIADIYELADCDAEQCYNAWRDTLAMPYPRWLERSPQFRAAFSALMADWMNEAGGWGEWLDASPLNIYEQVGPLLGYDLPWNELHPVTHDAITAIYATAQEIWEDYEDDW